MSWEKLQCSSIVGSIIPIMQQSSSSPDYQQQQISYKFWCNIVSNSNSHLQHYCYLKCFTMLLSMRYIEWYVDYVLQCRHQSPSAAQTASSSSWHNCIAMSHFLLQNCYFQRKSGHEEREEQYVCWDPIAAEKLARWYWADCASKSTKTENKNSIIEENWGGITSTSSRQARSL